MSNCYFYSCRDPRRVEGDGFDDGDEPVMGSRAPPRHLNGFAKLPAETKHETGKFIAKRFSEAKIPLDGRVD